MIVPCGITDKGVTSMVALLGGTVDRIELNSRLIAHYAEIFDRAPQKISDVEHFVATLRA